MVISGLRSTPVVLVLCCALGCSFSGMVDSWTGEDVNRQVRAAGILAEAVVLDIWETGVTVNDHPVIGFRLEVHAPGRPPWQAETRMLVSMLAIPRIQPGARLDVFYDSTDPTRVAIATEDDLPAGAPTPSGPVELGDDLRVEPLAEGIWLHVSEADVPDFGRSSANGLVVLSDGEAALVDTPWNDDQTRRLITWVAESWGARVSTVVPTHSHRDCAGGLIAAHRAGARSYASVTTAEITAAAGAEVPQAAFSDRLDLRLGSRTLQLRHLGAAHTADTIVVWIPDAGILFGGCAVRSASAKHLGYTAEADLEAWPGTIEAIGREYPAAEIVVPGHGRPGGIELLAHTLELLAANAGTAEE